MTEVCPECGADIKQKPDWRDEFYNNHIEIFQKKVLDEGIREMCIYVTKRCIELEKRNGRATILTRQLFAENDLLKEQLRKIPVLMPDNTGK